MRRRITAMLSALAVSLLAMPAWPAAADETELDPPTPPMPAATEPAEPATGLSDPDKLPDEAAEPTEAPDTTEATEPTEATEATEPTEPETEPETEPATEPVTEPTTEPATEAPIHRTAELLVRAEDGTVHSPEGYAGRFTLAPDFLMGDVNGDGEVNASDAAIVLTAAAWAGVSGNPAEAYLAEHYGLSAARAAAFGDTNEDGQMNASDAAVILIYGAAVGTGSDPAPLGSHTYFADADGVMHTGLVTDASSGVTYYADADYTLRHGFVTVGEERYYFDPESDAMTTGLRTIGEDTYCFAESGIMQTGWQELDGAKCWFGENGAMARSQMVDGLWLDEEGHACSQLYSTNKQRALDVFSQKGRTISALYQYCRSSTKYKKIESTRTIEQIEQKGWLYFVDYSMTHTYGVCYYQAAQMDFLLTEAGYECRMVHATHSTGDHYWNQILVNGNWTSYDITNGWQDKTWNQMVALGNYRLIGYVRPEYK